jgi:ribosomal protein S18 acetylase RimI-like enzyme
MKITSLEPYDFDVLFRAFTKAFKDYPLQLGDTALRRMLKRRGFRSELSFGAIDEELVSFTFNGIGMFDGKLTAYDTGTGTLEEYRGRGLAGQIFNYAIPFLKAAGVGQYLLEVLQENESAISVYKKMGFRVRREFNYFTAATESLRMRERQQDPEVIIKTLDAPMQDVMHSFHDFQSSWQNSFEAIARSAEDFIIMGLFRGERLLSYCIFEPASGDITQIATDKAYRRRGYATLLLTEALKHQEGSSIKLINTEVSCLSITGFMESVGMGISGKQYEMIREL